ncbi:MAG: NAD(+)/NADH kinase [Spirochaetia bacterium]
MGKPIRKVLIIANLHKREAEVLIDEIRTYMNSRDIETEVFGFHGKPDVPPIDDIDFVFSLGGDGTVLFTSRIVESRGIPILAVNLGAFGFITEITKEEWKSAFEKYISGKIGLSRRIMVKVIVERKGRRIATLRGLNDAVISSSGISKIVRLNLYLNKTSLGQYRADGIILSTPTGSTAYSLAAGGPILDPELEAFVLNPICPFTLSNRPIVISGNDVVFVNVEEDQRVDMLLSVDGQEVIALEKGDNVILEKSHSKTLLVRSDRRNFYEVLRSKLNWSGGTDA